MFQTRLMPIINMQELIPKHQFGLGCDFLSAYMADRFFRIKLEDEYSDLNPIAAGITPGSILGPILYLLCTCWMFLQALTCTATFADDTGLLAAGKPKRSQSCLCMDNKMENQSEQPQIWSC